MMVNLIFCIFSIISGQGVFGEYSLAKNTRQPRLIEMIRFYSIKKRKY
jgi:hypothetical protein